MISNSAIFSSSIFGNSSGATAAELAAKEIETQKTYLTKASEATLRTKLPKVPSNQRIAKDK